MLSISKKNKFPYLQSLFGFIETIMVEESTPGEYFWK